MDMLSGIFGNKTLVNLAMSRFKSFMSEEGLTAIMIRVDETAVDSDGVRFEKFKDEIAIASGDDVAKIRSLMECVPAFMQMTTEQISQLNVLAQGLLSGKVSVTPVNPEGLEHPQMSPIKGGKDA